MYCVAGCDEVLASVISYSIILAILHTIDIRIAVTGYRLRDQREFGLDFEG